MKPLIAIPVKPFGVAKARLSPVLDAPQRRRLGTTVAAHTVTTAVRTGATTVVVTGDAGVARWAHRLGVDVVADAGTGLDGAARAAVAHAGGRRPWIILHADLPLLDSRDLERPLVAVSDGRPVLAPSYDGGTTLLGATTEAFEFSYGPGSFHRHLQAAGGTALVVTAPGLMLDLDDPRDLAAVRHTLTWL